MVTIVLTLDISITSKLSNDVSKKSLAVIVIINHQITHTTYAYGTPDNANGNQSKIDLLLFIEVINSSFAQCHNIADIDLFSVYFPIL